MYGGIINRMKILQVTNKVPYPANDGGAIATLRMAEGFSNLGFEITVLAMVTLKHPVTMEEIPGELKKKIRFRLVPVPAAIHPFKALRNLLFSKLPYNAERFIDKKFRQELSALLASEEFDIVQLEGLYVCPYIETIRTHSNATIVYRAHNIEHEIWERSVAMASGLKKGYLKILSRRLKRFETGWLNAYDLLVPITSRDGELLNRLGNSRPLQVAQTGIDLTHLTPCFSSMKFPSVFHIGALDWAPNQEGILWFLKNCWGRLTAKYPDLKFFIAGRNAPVWLEKKFILPGVVYLGEIEDAYAFMNSGAVMVVPLFAGSGMRIKIIEGMALGKAIVSTSIGAEGIDTTHGENICIANTADAFVKEISRLTENKDQVEKLGLNAIHYIQENFDNFAIAGKLAGFYKKYRKWD